MFRKNRESQKFLKSHILSLQPVVVLLNRRKPGKPASPAISEIIPYEIPQESHQTRCEIRRSYLSIAKFAKPELNVNEIELTF